MSLEILVIALISALAFCGLCLMRDRPRGASIAQVGSFAAGIVLFVSLTLDSPVLGVEPFMVSAFGISLFSAMLVAMFYHLYLGRFVSVWKARGLFSLIYLGFSAVLGIVLLSLI